MPNLTIPLTKEDHDDMLMRLDQSVRRFKIDFERFFSGNLPIPPDQMRQNIQSQIQDLRAERLKTVSQRFRLNTLEAKFNALVVLFNRRLREQELGVQTPKRPSRLDVSMDPQHGILVDGSPSQEAVQALYSGLYQREGPGPAADFDQFQSYLEKQVQEISKKTGCSQVRFRISIEAGKPKLKAKPV